MLSIFNIIQFYDNVIPFNESKDNLHSEGNEMKAFKQSSAPLSLVLLVSMVVVLPACKLFESSYNKPTTSVDTVVSMGEKSYVPSTDTSSVLATINGKPLITENMLQDEFDKFIESNPQAKAILTLMPDAQTQFLDAMVSQSLFDVYISDSGIANSVEYKADLDKIHKAARQMLNAKYFNDKHPATVADADVKKFYDENKNNIPQLVESRGGVNVVAIQFDKDADAKAFLDKVKGKSAEFSALAKEANLGDKVRDFKLVNAQSMTIDPALRDKVLTYKTLPMVDIVKVNDKSFWVVNAHSKEETKYAAFEKVKNELREYVKNTKQGEVVKKELDALKAKYKVNLNQDFLDKQKKEAQMDMQLMQNQESMKEAMQKTATQNKPRAA